MSESSVSPPAASIASSILPPSCNFTIPGLFTAPVTWTTIKLFSSVSSVIFSEISNILFCESVFSSSVYLVKTRYIIIIKE